MRIGIYWRISVTLFAMQQFTVPQFIDVEDKIIGPITTRQFIILLATAIIIAICYRIFDFSAFIVASVVLAAMSGSLAFFKINGRPFHFFILNLIQTLKRTRLRVWNNFGNVYEGAEMEQEAAAAVETSVAPQKRYETSRLAELALTVDTRGWYKGEGKEK